MDITRKVEDAMRSPVKEVEHERLQLLQQENELLMRKADEYVRKTLLILISRERSSWTTPRSCKVL